MLHGNGLLEFLSCLRISYWEFCASVYICYKSNTNGEALWFQRVGYSFVCITCTFSVSNVIPRKL